MKPSWSWLPKRSIAALAASSIANAHCESDTTTSAPISPVEDGGSDSSHPVDGAVVLDASAPDVGPDSATCDPSERVNYNGNTRKISTSWGCGIAWSPTNVATPITVLGVSYPLTVLAEFCPPDGNLLDPLVSSSGMKITTNVGIWSLRFQTPNKTGDVQMSFLVYAGDTSAQAGGRYTIARWPGEYHEDARKNSCDYCDFVDSNNFTFKVVDTLDPTKSGCQLQKNATYYFNALVPAIDPRGNSSLFGWTSNL